MTLLLDTHAVAWAATDPSRLSDVARERISTATEPLVVSAVSAWEMAIKHRAGRWPEIGVVVRQFDDICARLGARALPLTVDHGLMAGMLEWAHGDPFDRALAAQAMSEGATLVSRDPAFRELPGLSVLW